MNELFTKYYELFKIMMISWCWLSIGKVVFPGIDILYNTQMIKLKINYIFDRNNQILFDLCIGNVRCPQLSLGKIIFLFHHLKIITYFSFVFRWTPISLTTCHTCTIQQVPHQNQTRLFYLTHRCTTAVTMYTTIY